MSTNTPHKLARQASERTRSKARRLRAERDAVSPPIKVTKTRKPVFRLGKGYLEKLVEKINGE